MLFNKFGNYLVLSTKGGKLLFFNYETMDYWTHKVEFEKTAIPTKPQKFMESENQEENDDTEKKTAESIELLAVSETDNLLALTTSEKSLYLYAIKDKALTFLSKRKFYRTGSSLCFFKNSDLLLADKTGEFYKFDCSQQYELPGKWILGHMSQILSTKITSNDEYILSADRDEKIRITRLSECPEIHEMCLGHKEFVSCLHLYSESICISFSGDKTLKIWDFMLGQELQSIDLNYVGIASVSLTVNSKMFLAVKTDDLQLIIYKCEKSATFFTFDLVKTLKYENNFEMISASNSFLIVHNDNHENVILEKIDMSQESLNLKVVQICKINEETKITFDEFETTQKQDLSIMYKKKLEDFTSVPESKRKKVEH